jgi:type VI protein secretion system component VasF
VEGGHRGFASEKQSEIRAAVLDFLRRHAGQVPAPVALPAAGSGGLLTEQGSGVPTWWYALVAGGALLVLVGLAGLSMTRSRR